MQLAGIDVELSRAEFDKYAAPLLLVHGLWTSPRIWRPAASYLAHRGWNVYTLSWRAAARGWTDLVDCVDGAAEALGEPVLIGHDLGALAALCVSHSRAALAISPLACGPHAVAHPFASSLRGLLSRWSGRDVLPSDAEARRVLGLRRDQLQAEAGRWFAEIAGLELTAARDARPRLILAGGADPCLSPAAAEALAARVGAELRLEPGAGHDLPYGAGWQAIAAESHRWLVQRLGAGVLLLRGDEDLRDE